MKKLNPQFKDKIKEIAEQVGEAYVEQRKRELAMKPCPKCQFEAVENGKCGHCGEELIYASTGNTRSYN